MAYHSEIYRRVTEILEQRRNAALDTAQAHREELHARCPEAVELDRALSGTTKAVFDAAMSGVNVEQKVAAIRRENEQLLQARRELLSTLGLPADYTEPHYTCPRCSDTGYIMARMCPCMKELLQLESLRESGVADADTQTFETFSLDYYRADPDDYACMKQTLASALAFAEDFRPGKENLLLIGGTGLGKTHLSTAIARRVIEKGYNVIYETVQTVFSNFEYDRFRRSYGEETPRAEKYLKTDLLLLDDLGTEFSSQFTLSCLYQLINTRLIRGLSTVISTNLTASELNERYDSRLTSRFLGNYRILRFVGRDIRFQKLNRKD
jgi:DNA replication protein DnaC